MVKLSNPLAFTRGPVTVVSTIVYIAIVTILIVIDTGVPSPPSTATPFRGVNLTEAWDDLQVLSAAYHPYNSRQNDVTRTWLLQRIGEILESNNASSTAAYVFDDRVSNLTYTFPGPVTPTSSLVSVYHEGLNIIVYLRGTEDEVGEWWNTSSGKPKERSGVLVNAHFDSVSTGYGATDDGVGVISILQLIKYYTTSGNTPKHGLVLLLNNGEEDFLNGASVFSQHPMSRFPSSFLNLEGVGAGGRAALFRSTDKEVTQAYAKSPYPFGTVISGDAFNRGLVRSQTDYVVFNGRLDMRGLDVAFLNPRSRYHTDEDDSRHTGQSAMWHMLSAAIATTRQLTEMSPRIDDENDKPHRGVWFDVLGRTFAVMETHTFFALAITVLVVGPIVLFAMLGLLHRADKLYLFTGSRKIHTIDAEETVAINGWRGFFRFPLILAISCAAPVALAYLLFKLNPYIAHSSEWAVWAMMVSSFIFVAWFLCRVLDFVRPSALTRTYGLSWLCVFWWACLVAAVIFEEQFQLAGGYFALFSFACALVATFLSYLELFSLPKKSRYCAHKLGDGYASPGSRGTSRPVSRSTREDVDAPETRPTDEDDDTEPVTEQSSLLRSRGRSAFKNYNKRPDSERGSQDEDKEVEMPFNEQEWSKSMWSWLWVLQYLVLVPVSVVLLGQLALLTVGALHQTGQDGSSMFIVYLTMAVMSILIFAPLIPVLHRFSWHIPMFLFFVLIATVLYNLLAFSFSPENRLKLFFQQQVDLNSGANNVTLTGIPGYVQEAVSYIPSAAGQHIACTKPISETERTSCSWSGTMPNIANTGLQLSSKNQYKSWVNYNVSVVHRGSESRTARFVLFGRNTRACKLVFDSIINDFHVSGQGPVDKRFPPVYETGSKEIRLWHREWDRAWTVDVTWAAEEKSNSTLTGKAVCMWSDDNLQGVIPALDEVRHFVPEWVAITKQADGLVEGYKRFEV